MLAGRSEARVYFPQQLSPTQKTPSGLGLTEIVKPMKSVFTTVYIKMSDFELQWEILSS